MNQFKRKHSQSKALKNIAYIRMKVRGRSVILEFLLPLNIIWFVSVCPTNQKRKRHMTLPRICKKLFFVIFVVNS